MDKTQHGETRRRRVRKRRSSSEGEKVVREDGSVVIRKRSKKRRSHQAHKEAQLKRRKRNLIFLISVFILCFIVVLGFSFSIAFHNSSKFQNQLVEVIEKQSGSEIELNHFKADYTQARAQSLEVEWPEGTKFLQSLKLYELKSKYMLGGLLSSTWKIDRVNASRGLLVIHSDGENSPLIQNSENERFGIDSLRCHSLDVQLANDDGKWAEGVGVTMRKRKSSLDFLIDGGVIHEPLLESFEVDQGLVRVLDDRLECAVRFDNKELRSALSIKGDISYSSEPLLVFNLGIEGVPSQLLIGENLAEILGGEASCESSELVYHVEQQSVESLDAELSFDELQFYGFPFLAELSTILRKQWYRRPLFADEASFHLVKNTSGMEFTNIRLVQQDRLLFMGGIKVSAEGVVTGELDVGVPIEHKQIVEESVRTGVFSRRKDGYLWEKVSLSGKVGELSDDFASKVYSRAELMEENQQETIDEQQLEQKKSADEVFNELIED
ncbi:hypothetical protein ACFPK9_14935 [Rubritalea spongiae]|uniref:AsmA-like C-terminal domain-containing protein n=1 Tax=Rubritalea spongiae TaxID=430797 RepID=A0ABW5DY27_9BACT